MEQTGILLQRAFRINSRNKIVTKVCQFSHIMLPTSQVKIMVSIVVGLLFGFFYFQIGYSSVSQQERLFLLLVSTVVMGVRLTAESLAFFQEEKDVLIPELENGPLGCTHLSLTHQGYYFIGPYFLTKSFVDLPFMLVTTMIFAVVMLPLSGLQYENER